MNTRFLKWLLTATVLFCMIFVAANVAAKKPVKPPPDPDPVDTGSLCVDSGSLFPAFAYVFTGELFLSNSEGDCSISIYKSDEVSAHISYRFFGDLAMGDGYGKIVWSSRYFDFKLGGFTRSKTFLLEFQAEAGAITTTLPLAPRLLLEEPESFGNVFHPDLNLTGDKVIISAYELGEVRGYIWEFDIPESGPVAMEDVRVLTTLEVDEDQGLDHATFHGPLYGLSDQRERIYFGYDYPDRKFSYIEKVTDNLWSEPTLITERWDGALDLGSVGLWDFGNGSKEVLARSYTEDDIDFIEILDVEACTSNEGDCVIINGIEGWDRSSFTTFTEGQLPALLYLFDVETQNVGYSIRECDLSILQSGGTCYRTVISGIKNSKRSLYGVDSAD
ncbi:MAG: hypothetical protein WBN41_10325 [Lysobacterales bacterium]